MLKTGGLNLGCASQEPVEISQLFFRYRQPAKPVLFVAASPERSVLLPQAADLASGTPILQRLGEMPLQWAGKMPSLMFVQSLVSRPESDGSVHEKLFRR